MASLVPEREIETVLGRELAAPVPQGAPLARASVASGGAGCCLHARRPRTARAGGSLRPGDRVTVLATFDSGAGAQARAIARGLRVLTVGVAPEGLDRASASIPVTVALSNPSLAAGSRWRTRRERSTSFGRVGAAAQRRSRRRASREAPRLERLPVVLALSPMAERAVEHLLFGRDAAIEPRASAAEADELDHEVPVAAASAVLVSPDLSGLTAAHCARATGLRRARCRSRQGLPGAAGALALGVDDVVEPGDSEDAFLAALRGPAGEEADERAALEPADRARGHPAYEGQGACSP